MANKKIQSEPNGFVIMNKDAQFFAGLIGGKPNWTSDMNDAKPFKEESKIKALKKLVPEENPEIVYL